MLNGPSLILLHVHDIDKTRKFYTDSLGYQVEAEQPGFVQFANTGGATLALSQQEGGDPVELWWFVQDADATHDELRSRGVQIVNPPKDEPFGRALAIKDASGHRLNLLQLPSPQ